MYRKFYEPVALQSLMKLMLLSSLSPETYGDKVIGQEGIGWFLYMINWK